MAINHASSGDLIDLRPLGNGRDAIAGALTAGQDCTAVYLSAVRRATEADRPKTRFTLRLTK